MTEDQQTPGRRSTRLSISIPVVIMGVDIDGNEFRESVRTLIVNKHGGKIGTLRHLAVGSEVLVENLALSAVAKANVVWLSEKHYPGDIHHVGLQLIEAQNVWGIAFPPDDWSLDAREDAAANGQPFAPPPADPEASLSSLAGEELTIRLLQELQRSADDHAREFEERVRQLIKQLGLELEIELRERAAFAQTREMGALEAEIKTLKDSLGASRQEIGELQHTVQELQGALHAATATPPPSVPLQEARRQLSALTKSVVESMNNAALAGLSEYKILLQKENQAGAERLRVAAAQRPLSPKARSPES